METGCKEYGLSGAAELRHYCYLVLFVVLLGYYIGTAYLLNPLFYQTEAATI